ncbi:hypothetical protein ACH5RR_040809 [Cinchona calisaya]|uniref:Uncharacterized protein n=1 Tax=Cinchona calisaya TaxID=153742 RepID=A0ABD2XWZ0_9GENT
MHARDMLGKAVMRHIFDELAILAHGIELNIANHEDVSALILEPKMERKENEDDKGWKIVTRRNKVVRKVPGKTVKKLQEFLIASKGQGSKLKSLPKKMWVMATTNHARYPCTSSPKGLLWPSRYD